METHEVVYVTLDGEEHEVVRLKQTKSSTRRERQLESAENRGWDGFDKVEVLEGRGFGPWGLVFLHVVIFIALFIIPTDPNAANVIRRDGLVRSISQLFFILISAVLFFAFTKGKKTIRVSPAGFHVKFLFKRRFVPWVGCGAF